jgi:hypothetical protein
MYKLLIKIATNDKLAFLSQGKRHWEQLIPTKQPATITFIETVITQQQQKTQNVGQFIHIDQKYKQSKQVHFSSSFLQHFFFFFLQSSQHSMIAQPRGNLKEIAIIRCIHGNDYCSLYFLGIHIVHKKNTNPIHVIRDLT